jgi:hypothetical protein
MTVLSLSQKRGDALLVNLKLLKNSVASVILLLTILFVAVNMALTFLNLMVLGLFVLMMTILSYQVRFTL